MFFFFFFFFQAEDGIRDKLVTGVQTCALPILGLRYEFNLPALNGHDQCADFSPTLPNPGASGRPGALVFCGIGPGRYGSHSITPGWYGGFGPRFGLAWNALSKTIVRVSGGSSLAPVKTVGGSAHFQGFAPILTFPDQTRRLEPRL